MIGIELVNEPDSFNKYGFETPNFEGEVLKYFEEDKTLIGYYKVSDGTVYSCSWHSLNGKADDNRANKENMNIHLTLTKKAWYEDEANFPCIILWKHYIGEAFEGNVLEIAYKFENKKFRLRNGLHFDIEQYEKGVFRLATKEEVLSLLIKD